MNKDKQTELEKLIAEQAADDNSQYVWYDNIKGTGKTVISIDPRTLDAFGDQDEADYRGLHRDNYNGYARDDV